MPRAVAKTKSQSKHRTRPDFSLENKYAGPVAGVDEAGRGPWAGPVVAAAAILDRSALPADLKNALDDSKKLKRDKRAQAFEALVSSPAVHYGVGIADVADIDRLNILQATLHAMATAVAALPVMPEIALVDGNQTPLLSCRVETVVKGDSRSLSIAAASIIAKETRDQIMEKLAAAYPDYGWTTNMGYGTAAHAAALETLGPTPHHRMSFAPVRVAAKQKSLI